MLSYLSNLKNFLINLFLLIKHLYLDAIISIIAMTTMIIFLTWATVVSEPLISKGNNKWMIAVWSWMTSKWSMASSVYLYRYSRKVMMPILDVNGDISKQYNSVYFGSFSIANAPLASVMQNVQTQTDLEPKKLVEL